MKNYLLIIIYLLSLCSSYAGTIDPSISDSKYIQYGQHFNYVGRLCGTYQDKTLFCASAVVLNENIIITAAHVVQGYQSCAITVDNNEYDIVSFVWPETFDPDIIGVNDIAIGLIKNPIKLKFYPSIYEDDDETGKVCSISGYGLTGNFLTGAQTSDLKRRAGSNIIDDIEKELLICRPSKHNDKNRTSLEFLIASGDSGGGLFIDAKLAGINSCVFGIGNNATKSTYNSESGHTRVSVHKKWILENIAKLMKKQP